jgi:hypothetical protein
MGNSISVRTGIRIAITECPAANLNIKLHGQILGIALCFPVVSIANPDSSPYLKVI